MENVEIKLIQQGEMNRNHRVYTNVLVSENEAMKENVSRFIQHYNELNSEEPFTIAFYPDKSKYDTLDDVLLTLISRFHGLRTVTIINFDNNINIGSFVASKRYCDAHNITCDIFYTNINSNTKDLTIQECFFFFNSTPSIVCIC